MTKLFTLLVISLNAMAGIKSNDVGLATLQSLPSGDLFSITMHRDHTQLMVPILEFQERRWHFYTQPGEEANNVWKFGYHFVRTVGHLMRQPVGNFVIPVRNCYYPGVGFLVTTNQNCEGFQQHAFLGYAATKPCQEAKLRMSRFYSAPHHDVQNLPDRKISEYEYPEFGYQKDANLFYWIENID